MDPYDRTLLDITRTGSSWTRVAAYWAGQVDDKICQNCLEGEEDANHFWSCEALTAAREEADKDLAELNPDTLPAPIKQGIAPALSANFCGAFWGECKSKENLSDKQWNLIGGNGDKKAHQNIQKSLRNF